MRFIKRQTTDNLNIDWHAFYKNVFALIIPMALQNLINVGVTAVDVMMLGRVGEKVLSGSSLAGQIQFIMMLIFFGITSGATVLTAQYWGKKDIRTIEKILGTYNLTCNCGNFYDIGLDYSGSFDAYFYIGSGSNCRGSEILTDCWNILSFHSGNAGLSEYYEKY